MASIRRTTLVLTASTALCSALLVVVYDAAADWDPDIYNLETVIQQHYLCGEDDLPEPGIQGDVPGADQDSGRAQLGYNCGLALVGHARLDFDGRSPGGGGSNPLSGNANTAYAGHCAYVANGGAIFGPPMPQPGDGVAVVDVSDSAHPRHVKTLRTPGSVAVSETIHAATTPSGRSILVAGQYGNAGTAPPPYPMDIYDVSDPDCSKLVFKGTYYWTDNIHNLTVSPDGRYVIATQPTQMIDISGLWDTNPLTGVIYLGNLHDVMEGPALAPGPYADVDDFLPPEVRQVQRPQYTSHEAATNLDWIAGRKILYLGSQVPTFEIFTILDVTDWLRRDVQGRPKGMPRAISQRSGRGHSVRPGTIGGRPYVVHSEESIGDATGCLPETLNPAAGVAEPWLTDISDLTAPVLVSQMGLEINQLENCPAQNDSNTAQSVHYHDFDDPTDTSFLIASMWNAGIRVFDVRDPAHPTEVAYFNPADVNPTATTALDRAWAHSRYVPERGEIWFSTLNGGFWVVRIEGQLRDYLDLDAKNVARGLPPLNVPLDDPGWPGTFGVAY